MILFCIRTEPFPSSLDVETPYCKVEMESFCYQFNLIFIAQQCQTDGPTT